MAKLLHFLVNSEHFWEELLERRDLELAVAVAELLGEEVPAERGDLKEELLERGGLMEELLERGDLKEKLFWEKLLRRGDLEVDVLFWEMLLVREAVDVVEE